MKANRSWVYFFSLGLFLILLILLRPGFAQETQPQEGMIPEEAQQEKWKTAFENAENVFNSEQQPDCIPLFQGLIRDLTEEKVKRPLTEPERQLLLKSLDYLGQAFYLVEQQDQASTVFLKLTEMEPNYRLNEDLVSPKIIDFYQQIKSENMGLITVTTTPPGARVTIDGKEVGTTDLADLYTPKGDHDLEVNRPGYFPKKITISVVPGKTQKINLPLDRSSSIAYFITYPKGVELAMTGKVLGTTGGEAGERGQQAAQESNLPPTDFSSDFPVPDLQPGVYEIEFRKPCWETQIRRVTLDKNQDFYFAPIIMEPSHAALNITADDPKANIFIDGEYIGLAPKQQLKLCSGKHLVKIKGPLGKFQKQIEIKKDQVLNIDAKLNPSLAFLGVVPGPGVLKPAKDDITAQTIRELSALKTLNFQDSTADGAAANDPLQQIVSGIRSGAPDKSRMEQIQDLCTKVESDLLLIAYVTKERTQNTVHLYLASNWSSMADVRTIDASDASQWKQFRDQLDHEEPLFEKRLGVQLIDTTITPGPVIATISLKTFEDAQPLNVGDVVTAVNDRPVKNAGDAAAAARDLQTQDKISLTLQRPGANVTLPVRMISSPMEVPFENAGLLFNRQFAVYKKVLNLSIVPLEKNVATLNVALCYIHFGEFKEALEQLRLVQLDRAIGIGMGTVKYHAAMCYKELGYQKETLDNLNDASRFAQNTLGSDDGIALAAEIDRAKRSLQ